MKITLAQLNPTVGDVSGNLAKLADTLAKVPPDADLVIFSELYLVGYPPRDLLEGPSLLERVHAALKEVAALSAQYPDLGLILGAPRPTGRDRGKGLYNAAALVEGGRVAAVGRKSLLPTYDVFDETRYFLPSSAATSSEVVAAGLRVGLSICEDVCNDKRFWDRTRYARDPIAELGASGASLVVNVSASPYAIGKPALRERMLFVSAAGHRVACS